ncbi:MAG: lysyl-tRNA synthetase [Gammaproteobacteria bacterium]|jgi:lysyl-tRNA synthetase class 2|nr:lysyl-tRNA synthetase [Gammaproteobacteria bacterium]
MQQNQHWQPTASIDTLAKRAAIIQAIRDFFFKRGVMEVETPVLGKSTTTDLHIESLITECYCPGERDKQKQFLQTSPEFPMKRLLAAGSGPIFQIGKAFRQDPTGRWHNPEFTLLEWYRPGFDDITLMDEVDTLLQVILSAKPAKHLSYQAVFMSTLGICPFSATLEELKKTLIQASIHVNFNLDEIDRDLYLQLLMSHLIEPGLGQSEPLFIYDYPLSQGGFAKVKPHNPAITARFEVYIKGIELANGYHEITNADEQQKRFEIDNDRRREAGFETIPLDENLLAALRSGFPDCSGVALGIDRLIMLALKKTSISEVMAFSMQPNNVHTVQ